MAQHKCNISIANDVYKARPLAGNLTIDSVIDYYSFRLITRPYEVSRPCLYICFLRTQPSLSAVRDPRTRRSYGSIYSVNDSVTNYLLLHSCPVDNNIYSEVNRAYSDSATFGKTSRFCPSSYRSHFEQVQQSETDPTRVQIRLERYRVSRPAASKHNS